MAERIVIQADAYRDEGYTRPLPRLIGPFMSREQAQAYMDALGPIWGSWDTAPLFDPELGLMFQPSSPDSPRELQPGDGPDYHAEHAAWRNRRSPDSGREEN